MRMPSTRVAKAHGLGGRALPAFAGHLKRQTPLHRILLTPANLVAARAGVAKDLDAGVVAVEKRLRLLHHLLPAVSPKEGQRHALPERF